MPEEGTGFASAKNIPKGCKNITLEDNFGGKRRLLREPSVALGYVSAICYCFYWATVQFVQFVSADPFLLPKF